MSQQSGKPNAGSTKSKILFDGNCIVCDFEISHYRRVAPDLFEMVDISSPQFQASHYNLTKEAVDKDMHVLTPDGDLRIGVDAFAHIWSRIPRYQVFSRWIQAPGIYPVAKLGYKVFTVVRPYLPKKKP